jgi:hypothetical protein
MIQIIDNKKVEMTPDEHQMFQRIVKSYTTATNKGEDLFVDLFETDDEGVIVFLKPPSKRQTSFEIWMFLMALFQHQHLRLMHKEVSDMCNQMREKMRELDEQVQKMSSRKVNK